MSLCSVRRSKARRMQDSMPRASTSALMIFQGVDVVFIPFHHLAISHGGRLDRHELAQPVAAQNKAARMLGMVTRRSDELVGKFQRQSQAALTPGEVQLLSMFRLNAFGPATHLRGQCSR